MKNFVQQCSHQGGHRHLLRELGSANDNPLHLLLALTSASKCVHPSLMLRPKGSGWKRQPSTCLLFSKINPLPDVDCRYAAEQLTNLGVPELEKKCENNQSAHWY